MTDQEKKDIELAHSVGSFVIPLLAYCAYEANLSHGKSLANLAIRKPTESMNRIQRLKLEKENKRNVKAVFENARNLFSKSKKLVDQLDLLKNSNGVVFQSLVQRVHNFTQEIVQYEFYGQDTYMPKKKPILTKLNKELKNHLLVMGINEIKDENGIVVWTYEGNDYELNINKRT